MFRRSCGTFQRAEPSDVTSRDEHATFGWDLVAQQEPEKRRLPRPGRPDEEHELTLANVEGDLTKGDDIALVDLADVFESDHGEARRARTRWDCTPKSGRDTGLAEAAFAAGAAPLQLGLDELVEVPVDDRLYIAGFG